MNMKLRTAMTRARLLALIVLAFSLAAVPAPAETIYDAAADFSATSNPNGAWSCGWSPFLGGFFLLDFDHQLPEGLDQWRGDRSSDGNPSVYHNGTMADITLGGTTFFQENELGLHPGPNGEYAVLRWSAPADGVIALDASFYGANFAYPTSTDAHVLYNGQALFDVFIEGYGFYSTRSLNTYLFVSSGDTIDFAVGYGRDRDYTGDMTGLRATIVLNP
jgi:hypothetical protein